MPSTFIRNQAVKLLFAGAVIGGVVYLAQRFQLGTRTAEGARAVGEAGGSLISKPIAGLAGGLLGGLKDITAQVKGLQIAGADFQEQATGNRDAIGDFISCPFGLCESEDKPITDSSTQNTRPEPKSVLDISKVLQNTAKRISTQTANTRSNVFKKDGKSIQFGGFGSAVVQETALQKAIAESRAANPQFFK